MASTRKPAGRTSSGATGRSPLVEGKLRAQRDDGRPTEDDIAKSKLGEQGIPGKPPKPPVADEDKLDISKPLDPGHTA
jgi:hypothetical protein